MTAHAHTPTSLLKRIKVVHHGTTRKTAADQPETNGSARVIEEVGGRGHIGLIVLGSIVFGLILGLVLVLGVFGGAREHLITGSALIALGLGVLTLFVLARFTDQPQPWALAPGVGLGIVGLALLILAPSGRVLGWLGWVWPLLLAAVVVWSWRGARHSLHNWSRRALLYPCFVILGFVALGGAYETIAEATTSNEPTTGRTYLVGGHRLYLSCAGSGSPTVVLFNGLAERTSSWAWVQRDVAATTRVCVFDRAGQGWSGKAPGLQDAHALSADVDGLLAEANIPGPYVVAGHSVGGAYALAYAMDYPRNVAGVALIDSATPYQFDLPTYPRFYSMWRRGSALLPTLARAGVARVYSLGLGASTLPPDARRQARTFSSLPREVRADRDEFLELKTVLHQDQALTSLDGKPLFVLTADVGQQSGWFASQDKVAALSTNSAHQTTKGATHVALLEDEHYAAVSSRAIAAVVRSVRTGTPLPRALSAAAPSPEVRIPRPTGQFHVGTRTMALADPARRDPQQGKQPRSVVIQFWYPTCASGRPSAYLSPAVARFLAKSNGVTPALLQGVKVDAIANAAPLQRRGGWPVVLFSPGFGVERGLYASLTEDLASRGYVVVAIDHPGDAAIVEFPDGHTVIPTSQMDIQKAFTVRVADTRFVLDELGRLERSGVFKGRLNLGRIGMFGHSLGGTAAASTMLVDRRVRAGADLDGLLFGQVRTSGLSRPFLLMNGEPGFAADPSRAGFWTNLHGPHYAVDVKGAQHFAFSDIAFLVPMLMRTNPAAGAAAKQLVGNIDGLATLAAERAYIGAFFDRSLLGKPQPLFAKTPGPFASVRLTVGG